MKHYTTRRKYTIVDGTLVPIVSGGADGGDAGDDDDNDDDADDDESDAPKGKDKAVPQDQVDRIVGREKARAERNATKALAKELGFNSVEEMKEALKHKDDAASQEERDLDKEREAVKNERASINRIKAEAAQDRLLSRVERRLVLAGAKPEKVEKMSSMIDVSVDDNPDTEDIDDAIASFKEEWSELFSGDSGDDDDDDSGRQQQRQSGRPVGSDTGRPQKKPKAGSATERAANRLRDRHPELSKG